MSKVRVLTLESTIPILHMSFDKQNWEIKTGTELTSHDSNFKQLYKEIDRYQIAEEMAGEEENEKGVSWLEERQTRGDLGEKLALTYLQAEYSKVRLVSELAYKGYDIEVLCEKTNKLLGFEIKTSLTPNKFYVTYNELQKAYTMKNNYFLFFIHMDKHSNPIHGFIIQNPVEELQLDFLSMTEPIPIGAGEVIPNQFRVTIKPEYIEKLNVISL